MIKHILKRKEESDTYLTHDCRYRWSRQITIKVDELGSVCSSDVYRRESGRCRSLPFILKYALSIGKLEDNEFRIITLP